MEVYRFINQITDIRYVFAQRIIFYITGENSTQQGMFNTAFLGILFAVLTVGTVQYFIISRPLGDILMFLRDTSHGKKGQRLYFSSPIKEIKESEEIINKFVSKAEKHEQ